MPEDIRAAFPSSITIRQVWRLVKGYIQPPQNNEKELIANKISTYPYHVPSACVFIGKKERPDGTSDSNLRGGFPTYQGPAIWYLWHSFASRLTELERSCMGGNIPNHLKEGDNSHSKMISTVKLWLDISV